MISKHLGFVFLYLLCVTASDSTDSLVGQNQIKYVTEELSQTKVTELIHLANVEHLKDTIKQILIPRIVGTPGHKQVREYIVKSLRDLRWSIELDSFNDTVPIKGALEFHNIIATLNPNAERYLVLACHYDSKYMPGIEFLGATDSAVPCAMLLNLAKILQSHLKDLNSTDLSLMLLFFDGEEAFKKWGPNDSIYGAKHLAEKWNSTGFLPKIDILMLLDLLGTSNPEIYNYFPKTKSWYDRLRNIEIRLQEYNLMQRYAFNYFHKKFTYFQLSNITKRPAEDDHLPFLERGVPILHIIPKPYPDIWHTKYDTEKFIDYNTTENLLRIFSVFVIEYLNGIK